MNKALSQRISIFLSVDKKSLNNYFNPHDPAPIYERQLRFDFIQYLNDSVASYKRHSTIRYKLAYKPEDFAILEPFMHAIHRHFHVKEAQKRREFASFKRSSYKLLFLSLLVVMYCQGLVPLVISQEHRIHSTLSNSLDVFSWVILWHPIDKLIFHWNPFLKEISLLHKLANAEVIEIEADSDVILSAPSVNLQVRA
jgi:hypothetical protein